MEPGVGQMSALHIVYITVIGFSYVHLGLETDVDCTGKRKDEGYADLTCKIPSPMDIVQVTWQKRTGNSYDTLVTNSRRFGIKISKPYEKRLSVLQTTDPGTSSITLSQLEKEDDACFTAIFNIYPDGALKGEVCLPKLQNVKEVICKSPADFRVTLNPPEIITRHSDPDNTIRMGRWIKGAIFPECNFELRKEPRRRRNVQEDEIFTIVCDASGTEKPTITWKNEGNPTSTEETVNRTGGLITVTSTRKHSLSTLPEGKTLSCHVSYSQDEGFGSRKGDDPNHEKNQHLYVVWIVISVGICVVFGAVLYIIRRKQSKSPEKENKAKPGSATPCKILIPNIVETPGTEIKQRKGQTMKKDKEKTRKNTHDSSYTLTYTDENIVGTPGSGKKQRKGSPVTQQNTHDSGYTLTDTDEMDYGFQNTVWDEGPEIKEKNGRTMKENKENNFDSSFSLTDTDGNIVGTPGTKITQRLGSTVKKNKKKIPQNNCDSSFTGTGILDEVTNGTPGSEMKQRKSPSKRKKSKSAKKLPL